MVSVSETTFIAKAVQFLRPDGRQKKIEADLPIEYKKHYDDMISSGFRLEAEWLPTGEAYFTVSGKEGDIDSLIFDNGPGLLEEICKMLARRKWERFHVDS